MNFQKFLDEGLATGHGKVESALRSLNLKYKIEKTDQETIFTFDDYTLRSSNSGKISIFKNGIRGPLAMFTEYNFTKINSKVVDTLKRVMKEREEAEKAKQTEPA